jgi:hypothetical protein
MSTLDFKDNVVVLDNALFLHQYNSGQRQFQIMMGDELLDDTSIDSFRNNMLYNTSIAERDNFHYKHIIFPAKPLVYKEQFAKAGINLRQIYSAQHLNECVLYPHLSPDDYYLNDTHMNFKGAFKILKQILREFGYLDIPSAITREGNIVGDLAKMLGLDSIEIVSFIDSLEGVVKEKCQKYSLKPYLKGNTGHLDFRFNPYALFNKRIIIFGDSFFRTTLSTYQKLFSEVIYFRVPYILEDVCRILEPDIVLTGNAERYLYDVPSALKPKPWFLNYMGDNFDSKSIDIETKKAFQALFSGKQSDLYKQKFGSKLSALPKTYSELRNLSLEHLSGVEDVFFLRDMAIHIEKTDLELARHLMGLAHQARPEGKLIKSKLESYMSKQL